MKQLQRFWWWSLPLLWLCLSPCLADGDAYRDGLRAYDQKHYKKALRAWTPLAEAGDPLAQYSLGVLYTQSKPELIDYEQAAKWFTRAADQGHMQAQFNLGNAYKQGRGVPQDNAEAVRWWRLAAEQGFAPAQYNLATAQYFGRGIKRDKQAALALMQKAAAQDFTPAMERHDKWARALGQDGPVGKPARASQQASAAPAASQQARAIPALDIAHPGQAAQQPTTTNKTGQTQTMERQPASPSAILRESWVKAQPGHHYTVQIMASPNEQAITDFIEKHRIGGKVAYFAFTKNNKTWYALIYGSFSSRADALTAVQQNRWLAERGSPWVRRLRDIHKRLEL